MLVRRGVGGPPAARGGGCQPCTFRFARRRQAWSKQDRRLYSVAGKAPWLLWAWMAKTARDLRRDPDRMLKLLPEMSAADERAVERADMRAIIQAMSTQAFRQGGRGAAHDLRLEVLPWGVNLEAITAPVDVCTVGTTRLSDARRL